MCTIRPIIKWDGVKGSSGSSLDIYDNGLGLSIISTSVRVVKSSSYVNLAQPINFLRHLLVNLTMRLKILPYQGSFSRLKLYCRPTMLLYQFTAWCVNTSYIALTADLKVLPLSDTILCGNPCLNVKCLKRLRKAPTVMSRTMSRCTALTTRHVYQHIHTVFSVTSPSVLICSGSAKSSSTYVNAGSSFTLN